MRTRTIVTVALLGLALGRSEATAQWNVARFGDRPNRVYTTVGLDPALVATVGYGRTIRLFGRHLQLSGDVGLAVAELDTRDFRARVRVRTSVIHWRSLHLTGAATFITRGTENSIYRGFSYGADLTGTLGLYRPGWFVAGEFGKDKAVITHVTHSEWYRTYFYPQARDGWYLDAGGTFHYGLTTGITVGRAELAARFGFMRTERFNDVVPPMYASAGIGVGF